MYCVMKILFLSILVFFIISPTRGQIKTIHVYVALCDNQNQGIVPVPESLGNGKDPGRNLYWGAAYGLKSFLTYKTNDWELVQNLQAEQDFILDRVLFKHKSDSVFLLADAYDGEKIKHCIEDFLMSANCQNKLGLNIHDKEFHFGGGADLVAYVGHDGLMDFDVSVNYKNGVRSFL